MTAHDLQPSIFLHNYHPYLFHLFFPQNGLKVNKAISFHFSFVFGGFLYFLIEFLSHFFGLACLSSIGMCGLACYAERTHILFFWHNQICLKGEAQKQKILTKNNFLSFFLSCKGHSLIILHLFFSIHLYTHTCIDGNNIITACLFLSRLISRIVSYSLLQMPTPCYIWVSSIPTEPTCTLLL